MNREKNSKPNLKVNLKKKLYEIIEMQTGPIKVEKLFLLCELKDRNSFDDAIDALIISGKIVSKSKNRLVTTKSAGLIPAKISSISKNFSFAIPLDSNLPDVYIPIEKLKGARVDDIVLLYHVRQSKKGFSANVERVVFKASRFVKGIFKQNKKGSFFIADRSYKDKIPVSKKDTMGAVSGDKVQAFITKGQKSLAAKIIKIYGPSESARICSDAIIDSYNVPNEFSEKALEEAELLKNYRIGEIEISKRLDLRNSCIFTIDGEDAKDLDDAISIRKSSKWFELGVHIADVSYFVKDGSSINREALDRGTSVYFADRVIPMLPKQISNGVCSLNPGEDKLTFSALIKIDFTGKITNAKFVKSVINSKVKGVYSEINKIFDGTASDVIKEKYKSITDSLYIAKDLAEILMKSAAERSVLTFEDSEPQFILDDNGVCTEIKPKVRGFAEKLIEQFMIKANEAVAAFAKKKRIPFVYRVHEEPKLERFEEVMEFCRACGFKCNKVKDSVTTKDLLNILNQSKGTKLEKLISNLVLRSMAKAMYSEEPDGHFGLSLEDYCHFTSPIRRYPDLTIHRILSDVLSGTKKSEIIKKYEDFVCSVSDQSTQFEIRAMNAERDAEKCYMAEYALKYLGETFCCIVDRMTPRGMFVSAENGIEGFINLQSFKGNHFLFDGIASFKDSFTGKKICIGDTINAIIVKSNVSTGTIDFEPV